MTLTLTGAVAPCPSSTVMVLWPAGETSSSPMSSGNVWLSPLTLTFKSDTEEPRPDTAISDG
jgi:hypothetical protein